MRTRVSPGPIRARCDCGRSRRRRQGTCARCARLDGENLTPSAAALLSELRHLGRSSWDAIEAELVGLTRRTLHRAVKELVAAGRLLRYDALVEREAETWGHRKRRNQSIAEFQLVEPRRREARR